MAQISTGTSKVRDLQQWIADFLVAYTKEEMNPEEGLDLDDLALKLGVAMADNAGKVVTASREWVESDRNSDYLQMPASVSDRGSLGVKL